MKSRQKAFTLIELLVVIAIIGLLASIVMVSLSSARSKARDAKRKGDLKSISTALELYYSTYGTYLVTDPVSGNVSGYYPSGNGWFSYSDGSVYRVSIGQALVNAGVLGSAPHDPGGVDSGSVAGKTGYMMYGCSSYSNSYSLWAGLENPSTADLANETAAEGTCGLAGVKTTYGVNYVVVGK